MSALASTSCPLGDVADIYALARKALNSQLGRRSAFLRDHDLEDAISYLVEVAIIEHRRFDPAKGVPRFSHFVYPRMKLRVVDWYRQHLGDTRYRPAVSLQSLDDALAERLPDDREALRELVTNVNPDLLTPESRVFFERIVKPVALGGLKLWELAEAYGWERRELAQMKKRLVDELQAIGEA